MQFFLVGDDGHSVIVFGGSLVTYSILVMSSNQKLHFQTLSSLEETLSNLGLQSKRNEHEDALMI